MLLEIGRVVYVNFGPDAGKIAVVVDIINGSRVIIAGPSLGVDKQTISVKRLSLTKFRLPNVQVQEKWSSLQFFKKAKSRVI